jgi:hypothetical protein
MFEPLGWTVDAQPIPLDEGFPEWGDSRYIRLRLTGVVRLADAPNQLHVLLPVLDESRNSRPVRRHRTASRHRA